MLAHTDLSADQAIWLNKYVRQSWYYENGKVKVEGNVTVTDKSMRQLPFEFAPVLGVFKCKGCQSLVSLKGFPPETEIVFEDCLFSPEIYMGAINASLDLPDYIDKHFHRLVLSEDDLDLISLHFPKILESHKGSIQGSRFGF